MFADNGKPSSATLVTLISKALRLLCHLITTHMDNTQQNAAPRHTPSI